MKTITDAIIYWGGYNFVNGKHEKHHTHILYSYIDEKFFSLYASDIGVSDVICTIAELNKLVDELACNMGNCNMYELSNYRDEVSLGNVPVASKENQSPKPRPVYTQEMYDRGELPSVGMECLVYNKSMLNASYEKCIVLFIGEFKAVYTSDSCIERVGSIDADELRFKPLTPPIELIEGKAYQFIYVNNNKKHHGIYNKERDRFLFIDGHVLVSYCTNIKTLTVESE